MKLFWKRSGKSNKWQNACPGCGRRIQRAGAVKKGEWAGLEYPDAILRWNKLQGT